MKYFSIRDEIRFRKEHSNWISVELKNNTLNRNPNWSESIAVGRKSFTTDIQQQLASRAQKRSIISVNGATVLKEPQIPYNTVFDAEKAVLSHKNTYYWRQSD